MKLVFRHLSFGRFQVNVSLTQGGNGSAPTPPKRYPQYAVVCETETKWGHNVHKKIELRFLAGTPGEEGGNGFGPTEIFLALSLLALILTVSF